jgi:hypothetical protein
MLLRVKIADVDLPCGSVERGLRVSGIFVYRDRLPLGPGLIVPGGEHGRAIARTDGFGALDRRLQCLGDDERDRFAAMANR